MMKRLTAEFLGTFWLVLGGCGSAVLAAGIPDLGIGFAGVALAFGLTVLTGAYAFGHVSGAHFNPAVTFGLAAGNRFDWKDVPGYVIAQVIGGIAAAAVLYYVAMGNADFANNPLTGAGAFATNGFGDLSPHGYTMAACAVIEVVLTAVFVIVIMGATHKRGVDSLAGVAIGLCLTLIHLISIPVTNTSVNPARSTAVALFANNGATGQLWFFWLMPIIGGILGGIIYRFLVRGNDE